MPDSISPFADPTPVRLESLDLTRGELAALLDDPTLLLSAERADAHVTARQEAVRKLARQARAQGLIAA